MKKRNQLSWGQVARAPLGLAVALGIWGCSENPVQVQDTTPPSAPQGVFSVTGDGEVQLNWIKNTEPDFSEYLIWRGADFEGPYTMIGVTLMTIWIDDQAQNGLTYFYAISAVDRAGNESKLSKEAVFDTPRPEGFDLQLSNFSQEPDGPTGYDFSASSPRLATDPNTDVFFDAGGGIALLVARDIDTDVQDAGFQDLRSLDWAPDEGWSPTGEVELIPGHSYYVWTRDNHYAKVECIAVNDSRVILDWAYQLVPGNPELAPHPRRLLLGTR